MSAPYAKIITTKKEEQKMRKALDYIKQELTYMNNDISFVKTISVYGYIIIGLSSMLVGLWIGVHN